MIVKPSAGTLAIDVDCPHCRAPRSQACLDLGHRNGRLIGRFHEARRDAAMAITRETNRAAKVS